MRRRAAILGWAGLGGLCGGLLLYGMRSSGKLSKLSTTTGAALLSRSLADQPIDSWKDVLPGGALLPFSGGD